MQLLGYLLDTLVCMGKTKLDILCQLVVDEPLGSHSVDVVHHLVEIIGRDIKFVGIKINGTMFLVVLIKQSEELDGDYPSGILGNELHLIIYVCQLLPGMAFLFWQCTGMMFVRLDGSPRYAMWIQVAGGITNILLDWLFIFPLGMGVKGAAIATSIACGVGGMMSLMYFIKFSSSLKFYHLKMSQTSLLLTLRNLRDMAQIGFATFLTEIAMSVTILIGNYQFMSMLHEDGVAAYAIICYLFPIIFSVNNAVAQAAQPIISYNYGAGQKLRVRQTLRLSLLTALTCGILVMLTMTVGAEKIVEMFLRPEEKAYGLAVEGLHWFSVCSVFFALNIAFIGYYQSVTSAGRAMAFTMLRGIIFSVAAFMLMPSVFGIMARYSCCRTGYAAHHYNPASKKIECRCTSESRVHKTNTNCISLQMLSRCSKLI